VDVPPLDAPEEGAVTVVVASAALRDERVEIAGDAYRHLFRARRLRRDERLRLVDGEGRARWAEVERLDRERALLRLGGAAPANDPARRVELLVATPRPERAAWMVEKATELGVAAVRFVEGERAVRAIDAKGLVRLRRVAVAALEQSGGARLPELSGPHGQDDLARLLAGADAWCLDPEANAMLPRAGDQPALVLIGPEGGWSSAELDRLDALGARRARLGARTLRLETAAIAAAALLLTG